MDRRFAKSWLRYSLCTATAGTMKKCCSCAHGRRRHQPRAMNSPATFCVAFASLSGSSAYLSGPPATLVRYQTMRPLSPSCDPKAKSSVATPAAQLVAGAPCSIYCQRIRSVTGCSGRRLRGGRTRTVPFLDFGLHCSATSSEELYPSSGVADPTGRSDEVLARTAAATVSSPTTFPSTSAVDNDCFLGADGGEYCVVEPATTTASWDSLEPTQSALAGVSLGVDGKDTPGEGIGGGNEALSLYTMMGLCFLVAIVCALDRVAMSVAIVPMGEVYGYSDTTKGLISSVFSWGYMASMVPSSVLIGAWGPKATMTVGVLAWSAAQMLSPTAAATSLSTLLACRFAMGVGEAVTLPSIQAIVAEWVPQNQRSRWLSLIISGLQVGTVLAYLASPPIIAAWNWEGVFLSYGLLGLAWLALWLPLVSDRPPDGLVATVGASSDSQRQNQQQNQQPQQQQQHQVEPKGGASSAIAGSSVFTPVDAASYPAGQDETGMVAVAAEVAADRATAFAAASSPRTSRQWPSGIANNVVDLNQGENRAQRLLVKTVDAGLEGKRAGEELGISLSGKGRSFSNAAGGGVGGTAGISKDGGREAVGERANDRPHDVPARSVVGEFRDVPWKEYATSRQIWSIAGAHMAHNWGLYVMLAWLPTYFSQEFSLTLGQSSGASVLPWVVGAVTGNMAGWGADALVNKGMLDLVEVRKLFQTLALVGPAVCMLALAQGPETSDAATLLFTAAVALGSCSSAGFGSSVQDLKSRHTGVIYGMTSACSAVAGSVGTFLTGVVLDTTDSWAFVFQATAAVYVVGAAWYGAVYRAEPLMLNTKES